MNRVDASSIPSRARPTAAWIAALAVLAPATLPAQPSPGGSPVEPEAGLGAFTLSGSDFPDVGSGPAVHLGLRGWLSERLSLSAGLHHSWHAADRLSASFRMLSLHLEPRMHLARLPVIRSVRPFLGLRGGYARWKAFEGSDRLAAEITASGLQAAGVIGVSVPLRPGLAVDLAGELGYVRFGDARVDAELEGTGLLDPVVPPDSHTEGYLMGLRTALRASLPWP